MSLYGGIELPGKPSPDNIRKLDTMIIPQLNRMSRYGIAVDIDHLNQLSVEFGKKKDDLQKEISSYVPKEDLDKFVEESNRIEYGPEESDDEPDFDWEINASSADQIRVLLFDVCKIGKGKKLKVTSTGELSTGKKNMDICREDHPVVPLVMQYREYSKLKSSFADALPKKARFHPAGKGCPLCELDHVESTNRLHTTFTTTRAVTGRLASKSPNLQQIPLRTPEGSRIRQAFMASKGTRLVSVDFSQMEIRDLAHLANATSMINVYRDDGDIHLNTAMKAFGIDDPELVDKYKHRLPAKRTNFGIQNGTTGTGLFAQLVGDYWASGKKPPEYMTKEWCDRFIVEWHDIYPEVQPYFDTQYYRARRYGFVWNEFGRTRWIPQVRSTLPYKVHEGLREAQNFSVTSSNAEQTKLAMAECEELFLESGVWSWPLLSIHDQVIAEVEEDYADVIGDEMVRIFEECMVDRQTGKDLWRCPIKAECEILERWKAKE